MILGMRLETFDSYNLFRDMVDFVVVTPYMNSIIASMCIEENKPFWVDLSTWDMAWWSEEIINRAEAIVTPTVIGDNYESYANLIDFQRRYPEQKKHIALHWGGDKALKKLKEKVWRVGLDWSINRDLEDSKEYHFQGFKTLDELRHYPPASLITNMPFYACYSHIDLPKRERRPQKLITRIDRDFRDDEIYEIKKNISYIREAGHGR